MAGLMAPEDDMAMQADGNMQEVPPGSLPSEVVDDIPAKLSEGEFVVPADVVRWHGLKALMAMRDEAKDGLAAMDAEGQIGGGKGLPDEPQLGMAPDLPGMSEGPVAPSTGLMGFAEGGLVEDLRGGLADKAAGGTRFAHQQVDWDGEQFVAGNLGHKGGDPSQIAQQGQQAAAALNQFITTNNIDKSKIEKGTAGTLFFNNAGRNVSARDLFDNVVGTKLNSLMAPTQAAAPAAAPEAAPQPQGPIQSSVNVPAPEQSTTPGELVYDKKDNHFSQTPYTPEQFAAKEQEFTASSALKRESDARAARQPALMQNPMQAPNTQAQQTPAPTTQLPAQGLNIADSYSKLGQSLSNQSLGTAPNGSQLYTPYSGMVQMPQAQYQQMPQQRFAVGGLVAPQAPQVRYENGNNEATDANHGAGQQSYDHDRSFMDNMAEFGGKVGTGLGYATALSTAPVAGIVGLANAAFTNKDPISPNVGMGTMERGIMSNIRDAVDSVRSESSEWGGRSSMPNSINDWGALSVDEMRDSYADSRADATEDNGYGAGSYGDGNTGFGDGTAGTDAHGGDASTSAGSSTGQGPGDSYAKGGFVTRRR